VFSTNVALSWQLLVVDLFHPKHKDWNQWLTRPHAPKWLSAVNEVARVLFAVLFLLVRTAWFPYVSVMGVWRDILRVANPNPGDLLGLYMMGTFNACFSVLQMYWGTLVVKQIVKIFVPDDKAKVS
jgi:hypothetical protein